MLVQDSGEFIGAIDFFLTQYCVLAARIFQGLGAEGALPEKGTVARYNLKISVAPEDVRPLLQFVLDSNKIVGDAVEYAGTCVAVSRRGGQMDIVEMLAGFQQYEKDFIKLVNSSTLSDDEKEAAKINELKEILIGLVNTCDIPEPEVSVALITPMQG